MLQEKKIGFIGSGNMGEALVSGLVLSKAARPENIICSDISMDTLEEIQKKYKVSITTNNVEVAEKSQIIVYATKPQILGPVLNETAPALDKSKLIISIAAGVPLAAIAAGLGKELRLIRTMPNICAFVKESATAIAAGKFVLEGDVDLARAIFDKATLLPDAIMGIQWNWVESLLIALPVSAIVAIVVSLRTQPESKEHLAYCFDGAPKKAS